MLGKRLEPDKSVAQQKKRWEKVFASMLERELGVAADFIYSFRFGFTRAAVRAFRSERRFSTLHSTLSTLHLDGAPFMKTRSTRSLPLAGQFRRDEMSRVFTAIACKEGLI